MNRLTSSLLASAARTFARRSATPRDFVIAWETSSTAREAALRLGTSEDACVARAASYRRQGVKLKEMPCCKYKHYL